MVAHNSKYPVLSTIANVLGGGGLVLVAVGAFAFLYGFSGGALYVLGGIVIAVLGLVTTALGELVGVMFDIEHNTRTATTSGRTPERTPQG